MTLTSAQKQAALRARKRDGGLARLELWLLPELHDRVKAYAIRQLVLARKQRTITSQGSGSKE